MRGEVRDAGRISPYNVYGADALLHDSFGRRLTGRARRAWAAIHRGDVNARSEGWTIRPDVIQDDPVRKEVMAALGYFLTGKGIEVERTLFVAGLIDQVTFEHPTRGKRRAHEG